MIALLAALQTALQNDTALSAYNEVVSVRKWRSDSLPEFDVYGIVLSPQGRTVEDDAIRSKRERLVVRLYCLVYDFDATDSLIGVASGAVGILKMATDVAACLEGNDLGGYVEITGEEVNGNIALNEIPSPNRDKFYHEVMIELTYYKPARSW